MLNFCLNPFAAQREGKEGEYGHKLRDKQVLALAPAEEIGLAISGQGGER